MISDPIQKIDHLLLILNLAVTGYALGEAAGNVALMQLMHVEADWLVVDILRECMTERELERTVRKVEAVTAKVDGWRPQ